MDLVSTATNATKGLLTAGANLVITGLEVFNIVELSEPQTAWIYGAVNFASLLWITLTYKKSSKRADG